MKPLIRETQDKRFVEVIGHYDNPVLCAKLTLLADMFAVEHKEGYAKFRVEDEDKLSFIDDKLEFLTNLTNTKWVLNDDVILSGDVTYDISFTSNNSSYSDIYLNGSLGRIKYYNLKVYDADMTNWTDQSYRIISITGGTDVTNANLIDWLLENATQVPVTDLTNTNWIIDDAPGIYDYNFSINFNSNNHSCSALNMSDAGLRYEYINYYFNNLDENVYNFDKKTESSAWEEEAYRIISITGGTDVTNPDLLVWLNDHATLVPVVDLTNTKWAVSNWTATYGYGAYDLSGYLISGNIKHTLYVNSSQGPNSLAIGYYDDDEGEYYSHNSRSDSVWFSYSYVYNTSTETGYADIHNSSLYPNAGDLAPFTLEITGGNDISNPDLIVWLTENATLQVEPVTYTITPTLTHITSSNTTYTIDENGTWTTTLTADTGYDLPSSVSVTNATVSSYNSTTGVLTLSNPTGNVTLVATATEHIEPSTNKISFGNLPIDKAFFGSLEVKKMYLGDVLIYENQDYVYSQSGTELTIENAPYSQSGSELTIL